MVVVGLVVGSTAVASVPAVSTRVALAAFMVALWLPRMLEAESAAEAAESALADRAFQVVFRTLLAQGLGSLQLDIHHPGSLSMKGNLIDP